MLSAFSSGADFFKCPPATRGDDLMNIMQAVLGDNPSVVYFDNTQISTEESSMEKRIDLTRIFPKSQAAKMNSELEEAANRIASAIKRASNDEYSLLLNLSKYLQVNVRYDMVELNAVSRGISKYPASHNAYGALVKKLAVCDGFSSAFSLLAQKLGFESMLVYGRSEYSSSPMVEHAWNILKVRNNHYHVDITWDARKFVASGELSYDYFMLTDGEISNDHTWNTKTAPKCQDASYSYFLKNGLLANNIDQLKQIIRQTALGKSNVFRIKLSPNIRLSGDTGDHLAQMTLNEVATPGIQKHITYFWNDNTRCFFAKVS